MNERVIDLKCPLSGIFAMVIRRTNWETLSQKYTLKRWGKSTSERVIDV